VSNSLIGVLLATFTACTWGSISVLEARVSRALGGPSALAWVFGFGLVVILPIALIQGVPQASASAWAWALVASGGSLAGLALMFTAYQYGRIGLVTATISVQGAFAAIYAAIGGEALHPLSLVAIAVSAIGTYVLLGADGGATAPPRERRGILLALAGAGFTGISLYAASRGGSGIGATWVVLCVRVSSVAMVTIPLALMRRLRSPRGVMLPAIISAIGEVAAFAAYIAASDRMGVAVPAVIASQFALIAATVGWVVLGERLGPRQLAGAGAILAGVTALTIIQG
jgi:drug/metabolite transporter (DMT)-like permease